MKKKASKKDPFGINTGMKAFAKMARFYQEPALVEEPEPVPVLVQSALFQPELSDRDLDEVSRRPSKYDRAYVNRGTRRCLYNRNRSRR